MLDILIIGPMGQGKSRNSDIKTALDAILKQIDNGVTYRITIPEDLLGGNIVDNVFYEMDVADFVIGDITHRSPNVFYEISLAHSLGKPIILIDFLENSNDDIPFYLNQTYILRISANEDSLEDELNKYVSRFLDPKALTNYSESVISLYYGLPLVNISAVMGVAFGYFSNFIKPFLERNRGAIAIKNNNVSHLCIVRPKDLNSEDFVKKRLGNLLVDSEAKKFECLASTRGAIFCPFVKGDRAYDVPAALFTLRKSPRLKKVKNKLNKLQHFDEKLKVEVQLKFEHQVIEKFFNHLEFLIQEDAENLNDTYNFVRLSDIKE